jgi:hypothetical protein
MGFFGAKVPTAEEQISDSFWMNETPWFKIECKTIRRSSVNVFWELMMCQVYTEFT